MAGTSQFNTSVSLSRVIGMVMIVLCHIATALGLSAVGQLLQSGVQLFLFISGYLYSNKRIESGKHWLHQRFCRVCIPCYLWIILVCCAGIFANATLSGVSVTAYLLNLQGYHYIFAFLPRVPGIGGLTHLWFITVLLVCYLLTLLYKRHEKTGDRWLKTALVIGLVLTVPLGLQGLRIDYIWIYFAGYAAGKKQVRLSVKKYILLFAVMAVSVAGRMVMKRYCDVHGDNNLYLYVVIPLAYNAMALWLYYTIDLLNARFRLMERLQNTLLDKGIHRLDALSFYIYITHYAFMDGPFAVVHLTGSPACNIAIFLLLTVAASYVLQLLSGQALKILTKHGKDKS